jgi:hypothetical protein
LPIRGLPVGGLQNREEIRKEVDQHGRGYEVVRRYARERKE